MTRVYITEVKRSAIGRYLGALSNLSPLDLGSQVLRAVLESDQVPVEAIEEVIVGNVLSAGHGQPSSSNRARGRTADDDSSLHCQHGMWEWLESSL